MNRDDGVDWREMRELSGEDACQACGVDWREHGSTCSGSKVSDRPGTCKGMSNSLEDVVREAAAKMDVPAENEARLKGLFAVLALPARRAADGSFRRPMVEVEVAPGTWSPIDSISVESERLTFSYGSNGTRVEYVFDRKESVPRWRTPDIGHRHFVVAP